MAAKTKLDLTRYDASEHGNFAVIDTIGVPHAYCIGPKHVEYASKYRCGVLDEDAIKAAERGGAKCCTCHGQLAYKQHEIALLVECKAELRGEDGNTNPELHAYLLQCKPNCEADGYVGFAFIEAKAA